MFGISREKGLVGLDIGSYSVKAVELKPKKKGDREAYEVTKIGYEALPHDAIVEGTIIDSAAVVETIRLVCDENKISNKDVSISISGNSVIIKKISLPVMEKQELAESIIWEAKHNIPYPYEETNVDYAILKPSSSNPKKPSSRCSRSARVICSILVVASGAFPPAPLISNSTSPTSETTLSRTSSREARSSTLALYPRLRVPDSVETASAVLFAASASISRITVTTPAEARPRAMD